MSGRSEAWHRLGPAIEDEFVDVLRATRFSVEWLAASNRRAFRPPFDVYETDRHIVIKVEIAGMREEDFTIALDGRVLSISGARRDPSGKLGYYRMEINYGEFRLDFRLPHPASEDEIEASYDRGFLSVSVPRRPPERRIPVAEARRDE